MSQVRSVTHVLRPCLRPDHLLVAGRCVPPSNHFEKLRGNLAGFHSIRVNSQWRLIFRWDGSRDEVEGIYLDDHSYR